MNSIWQAFRVEWHGAAAQEIGRVLVHSLWQGAIVAGALAVTLFLLRKRSASARYIAACAALTAMVALPIGTAVIHALEKSDSLSAQVPHISDDYASDPLPLTIGPASILSVPTTHDSLAGFLEAVSWIWAAGVAVMSLWNLSGWVRIRGLPRKSVAAPERLQASLAAMRSKLRVSGSVAIRVCQEVAAPAVLGIVRPVILVPASALSGLSADHLQALLLHELAHVKRHDYLFNLLQTAAETLLFYHPAAWWVSAQIRRERENCCDDLAARACGSAVVYARALTAMEEVRGAILPSFALSILGSGRLLRRIERLVSNPAVGRRDSSPLAAGIGVLLLAAAVLVFVSHPSGADAQSQSPTEPAARSTPEKNTILPEDLERGTASDYKIGPNDLLAITISGLSGPNIETIKQSRVSQSGVISMPYLNSPIRAVGLSEIQLEHVIVQDYAQAKLIEHAPVSVTIIEARGRAFSITGAVDSPGSYPIFNSDFRLLNAIAAASGTISGTAIDSIRVLRAHSPDHIDRTIDIPAARALAGDESLNIIIRPGDTIVVNGSPGNPAAPRIVRLIVGTDSLRFEGKPTTWDQLNSQLGNLPKRRTTVLEIAPETPELPVGKFFEADARARELARKWTLKYQSQITAWEPGSGR